MHFWDKSYLVLKPYLFYMLYANICLEFLDLCLWCILVCSFLFPKYLCVWFQVIAGLIEWAVKWNSKFHFLNSGSSTRSLDSLCPTVWFGNSLKELSWVNHKAYHSGFTSLRSHYHSFRTVTWKLLFHIFVHNFCCFKWQDKSGSFYFILDIKWR